MADVTNVFKASVKASRSINRAIHGQGENKQQPLSHTKQKSEFESKAKDMVTRLTQLRDFLLKHRQDYINPTNHLSYTTSQMSDAERDTIDDESQNIIKKCQTAIQLLRDEVSKQKSHTQVHDHRLGVFELLEAYLKGICRLYSEQRAIRVKRVVDKKRISRLEPEKKIARLTMDDLASKTQGSGDATLSSTASPDQAIPTIDTSDISPEEAQMFQKENEALFDEMNSTLSEVRKIEGQVVEISRLQEIFSEKVLEQEKDIDRIAETTAASTDNIKDANEEIREAMKNNASFRVWILFILVVCSFSLLFLDWYND